MPILIIFILCIGFSACQPGKLPEKEDLKTLQMEEMEVPPYKVKYDSTYLMGQFAPEHHAEFVKIDRKYADRDALYMRAEAYEAFIEMWDAAQKDGIPLVIRSATRNFDYQKGIWERKWNGQTILSDGSNAARDIEDDVERALKILEYSSMPGTSRHHWGTDVDFNAFENSYFERGEGKLVFDWLEQHAQDYGFARPYTTKGSDRPFGYNEEKWHWSYLPLSTKMTQDAQYQLTDEMIKGFKGDHTPEAIGIVEKYILGIHKSCKQWH